MRRYLGSTPAFETGMAVGEPVHLLRRAHHDGHLQAVLCGKTFRSVMVTDASSPFASKTMFPLWM